MVGRSEVVAVTDPGSKGAGSHARPAAPPPPHHLPYAANVPPLRSGDFSRAVREYADGRAHGFEHSVSLQQSRSTRLAVIAGLLIGIVGNVAVALTQVLLSNAVTAIM